jgi:hypothetical protein
MSNIIVSIIIPVGFVYSGLDRFLDSFIGKEAQKNYEIILGIDEGDFKNIGVAFEYQDKLPLKTFIWDKGSGYYKMHEKTNWLAKNAEGEFIWWLSDECRMITWGWAKKFIELRKNAHRPTLIHPKTRPVDGAKYPAINRCWHEKTGQFTGHPSLDSWLNTVRERAKARWEVVNVKIKEVKRPKKETARGKVMGMGEKWISPKLEKEINEEVNKLKWKKKN